MNSIALSTHGGIVVRRVALNEKQVSESSLPEAIQVALPAWSKIWGKIFESVTQSAAGEAAKRSK